MSRRLRVEAGSLVQGERQVTGDAYRYLFRALRLAVGDQLELFDGAGYRANAKIVEAGPDSGVLAVAKPEFSPPGAALELTILVSMLKGERMDWCVQKLTELGVSAIVPVQAARSVVRLVGERAGKRQRRLEAVATDAARQCGRARVPQIHSISSLPDALALVSGWARLILDVSEGRQGLASWCQAFDRPDSAAVSPAASRVAVLVGPEGGFESGELRAAQDVGFESVGLGPRILRAETAAIAAAAALQFALGDLGGS